MDFDGFPPDAHDTKHQHEAFRHMHSNPHGPPPHGFMGDHPEMAMFMRNMHRFMRINFIDSLPGMSRGEYFLLEVLHEHELRHPKARGMYAGSLAEAVRMSPPGVSRLLKALEGRGYVARSVDEESRRNTFIRLTPAGDSAREQSRDKMQRFVNNVLKTMGPENMQTLLTLWSRLMDILENELKASEGAAQADPFPGTSRESGSPSYSKEKGEPEC